MPCVEQRAALLAAIEAAGAREWSDEFEAVSGILGAAGVFTIAVGRRRLLARDLVRRKATASDVLTWCVDAVRRGRGAGWLVRALQADPECVWKARSCGAAEQTAGPINWIRVAQIDRIVQGIVAVGSLADHATRTEATGEAVPHPRLAPSVGVAARQAEARPS